jgi:hypothetical protein
VLRGYYQKLFFLNSALILSSKSKLGISTKKIPPLLNRKLM